MHDICYIEKGPVLLNKFLLNSSHKCLVHHAKVSQIGFALKFMNREFVKTFKIKSNARTHECNLEAIIFTDCVSTTSVKVNDLKPRIDQMQSLQKQMDLKKNMMQYEMKIVDKSLTLF